MSWLRRLSAAPATWTLLVLNLAVFANMLLMSRAIPFTDTFDAGTLIRAGANAIDASQDISRWRWLTAAFVHVNLLHIAMNMWVLAQIGVLSERAVGSAVIAATYVVTGLAGNFASTAVNHALGRTLLSAGASSAIMGLIGLAAAFAWRTGQRSIARSLLLNVAFVLALGVGLSLDNAAHVGGLLAGAAIGLLRARYPDPLPRWLNTALVVGAAAVSLVAFAFVISFQGAR